MICLHNSHHGDSSQMKMLKYTLKLALFCLLTAFGSYPCNCAEAAGLLLFHPSHLAREL